jgi:thiamine pyrophosphokinase
MKSAAIFIHSRYPKAQLGFYRKLCQGKFKIAADGGYNFFKAAGIKPDIIIGDFDSLNKTSVKNIRMLEFPRRKNQTDTELALQYCIEDRYRTIDIVMPITGEPDHFMGLISLLQTPEFGWQKKFKVAVRIVNHDCEMFLLVNRDMTFIDCRNEKLSVLPYGGPIRLTCLGMEYPAEDLLIKPWQTRGMRNLIRRHSARIAVKGTALVVHYWGVFKGKRPVK